MADVDPAAQALRATQILTCCIFSVQIWDWLICIPREIGTIWMARWSIVKCLFIWARYFGLAYMSYLVYLFLGVISVEKCSHIKGTLPGLALVLNLTAQSLLIIRCWALWQKSRAILAVLLVCLVAEGAIMIWAASTFVAVPLGPDGSLVDGPCIAAAGENQGHANTALAFWATPLVLDALISFLTFTALWRLRRRGTVSPLFHVLLRDGFLYVALITGANLLNVILYLQSTVYLQAVASPFEVALQPILACRLVISLKDIESTRPHKTGGGLKSYLKEETSESTERRSPIFPLGTQIHRAHSIDVLPYNGKDYDPETPAFDLARGPNGLDVQRSFPGVRVQIDVEKSTSF